MQNANRDCLIETKRLTLGRFQSSDSSVLAQYRNLPVVARFQSWEEFPLLNAEQLISSMADAEPGALDNWFQYAVRLKSSLELIGDIGFKRRANGPSFDADIGFTLDPRFQKRGYMREAVQGLIDWSVESLLIRRFVASVDPRNEASLKLLEALNFKKEAHHTQSYWFKGAWADDAVYVYRK